MTTEVIPPPIKINIAAALHEIGILLELKGGRYFQARAFKSAARVVSELGDAVDELINENRLRSVAGIGEAIGTQIEELHCTGTSRMLERLRSEVPRGSVELSTVPGLSLKKIQTLHDALGIETVAELKTAAEQGKIRSVKGFGPKSERNLLEAIGQVRESRNEIHIHKALRIAEEIVTFLSFSWAAKEIQIGGALRRWRETTPDLKIVVATSNAREVLDHFAGFPMLIRLTQREEQSCVAVLHTGIKVTVLAVPPRDFAITLLNATGSDAHLERLNEIAASKTIDLGPTRSSSSRMESEVEIYAKLGLQYVPPELREDEGEIESAMAGELPQDLIQLEDIRGMLHCHTNYSDGKHTIEEMARGADALGVSYLTITDHSPTAFYAGGVEEERLWRQWDEIDQVQENVNVKILRGTESDILADGSFDYPDRILEQFDVIIASIHARYRMNEDQMTNRIVRAMRQPWFKIWGHALGRLIQHRPPFKCRVEEILDAVAESCAAIEINADPYRLDMAPEWIRKARKRGIKFVISTDAHSINGMKNLKFGIGIARRGWVRKSEVLNTLGSEAFRATVRPTGCFH